MSHADDLILRPYQENVRAWAHTRHKCGLLLDMGLGKTPTTLQIIDDSLNDYLDTQRWCVVGPRLVAADVWPRAIRRWRQFAGLTWRNVSAEDFSLKAAFEDVQMADGSVKRRKTGLTFGAREDKAVVKRTLRAMPEQIHFVSWDFFPWLVKAYGANWPYDGLVLDESLFAQNSTSERHKAAYHVIHRLKKVNRVIELTGLPSPNGIEQMHGQMRLLDGGARLGDTKTAFYDSFMVPDKRGPRGEVWKWKLAGGAREAIDSRVAELCVSLKTEDYLQLPPQTVNPLFVTLPDRAREAYDTLERDLVAQIDGVEVLAPSAGAKASKLLQIANGAVYDTAKKAHVLHDAKIQRIGEVLESTDGPVMLAYSFQHDWDRIKKAHKHAIHVRDVGALDKFRRGEVKLMCLHPESGAEGLDGLQEVSNTSIWFGATYNYRHWAQFNKRLHRDGSRFDRVTVHQILADDTIENYVAGRVIPDKVEESDLLLEAIKLRRHSA